MFARKVRSTAVRVDYLLKLCTQSTYLLGTLLGVYTVLQICGMLRISDPPMKVTVGGVKVCEETENI